MRENSLFNLKMIQNNLTLTMQHFGKLTATERELFLSVISSNSIKEKKEVQNHLYSEEYFYELLKANHNKEVRARIKKNKLEKGKICYETTR